MPDDQSPWHELTDAGGRPYDPRPALGGIEAGTGSWHDLGEILYHQGDVGTAAYAVPQSIAPIMEAVHVPDWRPFSLAVDIELARLEERNPKLPLWLAEDYQAAWARLFSIAWRLLPSAEDENLLAVLFAVLAIGKRRPLLARMAYLSEKERGEMLEEVGWA